MEMYLPGWDPSEESYANTTIDLSHAAIAGSDVVEMAVRLGVAAAPRPPHRRQRLAPRTSTSCPGRGVMGAADFLRHVADSGFAGDVVLEINTRKATSREQREADLRESLEFAREHFAVGSRS